MTSQQAKEQQEQQNSYPAEQQAQFLATQGAFATPENFDHALRMARALCRSTMVPKDYQGENNLGNCIIALEMAQRIGASPFAVMQNLHIIQGRPSWGSSFILAALNTCGKFSPIRFEEQDLGEKTVQYHYWQGKGENRKQVDKSIKVHDKYCRAWAYDKTTGEKLYGPPVTIEMAVKEGWYTKNDSKWQTMPDLMLRYRAAAFFGRLYAPDVLMGMHDTEEAREITINRETGEVLHSGTSRESVSAADLNEQILNGDSGHTEPQEDPKDSAPEQGTEQAAEASTEGAQSDEPATIECPDSGFDVSRDYCNRVCTMRQGCPAWE